MMTVIQVGYHPADAPAALPQVREVQHMAGEDYFLIKVRVRDPEAPGR